MPKAKALVALQRSILVIIFHLLADPTAEFTDLGPDFYTRASTSPDAPTTCPDSSRPWATTSSSPLPTPPEHSQIYQ